MEEAPIQGHDSKFKLWSLGVVVEDKPFETNKIRISPHERLPLQSGPVGSESEQYDEKVPTSDGVAAEQTVSTSNVIVAEWFANGDNHLFTSPMVRKNEIVQIYKYADKPDYYWTTLFSSPEFRRVERIIYGAGNLAGGTDPLSIDSIYYIEFDTLSKAINIKTSLSDGERFMYTFSLNPGQNQAYITDHIGNRVVIDSENNNVFMEDASGGMFETRDGHPKITGPKGILLTAPSIVVEGNTDFKDSVIVRKTLTSVGVLTMNSGMAMQAGNGGSGGQAVFDGDLRITKTLRVEGTSTFEGYVTMNGGHTGD